MKPTEAEENYLEIILILSMMQTNVRAIDVANRLERTRPSTSEALKKLKDKKFIDISSEGYITLTDTGNKFANATYDRFKCIYNLLKYLGVSEEVAFRDACKIEHRISQESFEKLKKAQEYFSKED